MADNQSFESAESESRYRFLRAAVADYHYHVQVEGGRVLKKIHGANCEVVTGDYLAAPDGEILLCNQAFADIFGFSRTEDAVGSNLSNLYGHPLTWPGFVKLLSENKVLDRYERAGRHSDGTIRHVIETILGTFDAQGSLVRIKGYVYDDTDSRIRESRLHGRNVELEQVVLQRTRDLREKHEHLRAVWNSAFDAIITIDSQGIIETANRATERMFGYASTEMIGQNVRILMQYRAGMIGGALQIERRPHGGTRVKCALSHGVGGI